MIHQWLKRCMIWRACIQLYALFGFVEPTTLSPSSTTTTNNKFLRIDNPSSEWIIFLKQWVMHCTRLMSIWLMRMSRCQQSAFPSPIFEPGDVHFTNIWPNITKAAGFELAPVSDGQYYTIVIDNNNSENGLLAMCCAWVFWIWTQYQIWCYIFAPKNEWSKLV